jgi:hypothetical protein
MRVEGRVSSISSYLTTEAIGDENFIKETNKTKKDPNEITTDDILLRGLLAPPKKSPMLRGRGHCLIFLFNQKM